MKTIKRTIAAILACVLALSATACSGDTTWAYKYNDDTVAAGVYIMYLYDSYYNAQNTFAAANDGTASTDIFKETIEEKDAKQWMKDDAAIAAKAALATRAWLKEIDKEVTDDDYAYSDQMAAYYWASMSASFEPLGVSEESFTNYFRGTSETSVLFHALYGEGGPKEVPDTELRPYYNENFYQFQYVSGSYYSGGTALSDAEKTLVKQRFEGYLAQIQEEGLSIDEINVLEKKYQKEVAATSSSSSSSDSSEEEITTENSPASALTVEKTNTQYFSEAGLTKLGEMENGEYAIAEDDYGVYLMYKKDITADDDNYESNKSTALSSMKQEEFYEELDAKAADLKIEVNSSAINHYDPKMFKEMEEKAAASASQAS